MTVSTVDHALGATAGPRPWWETRVAVAIAVIAAAIPLIYPSIPPLVDLLGHMGRYRVELVNPLPGEDTLGTLAGLSPLTRTYDNPATARQAGERWRRYYGVAEPLRWLTG